MALEKGESSSKQFEKRKRDLANISGEWRLATVEEVRNNLHVIKQKGILQSRDIARLFDGWVAGPSYRYEISSEYKAHMTDMIVVKTGVSRRPDNSFCEETYSEISSTLEGRRVALLLSCDDKIAEVLVWVLRNVENQAELDELKKSMDETFGNGRTILHYAGDHEQNEEHGLGVAELLMNESRFEYGKEWVKSKDKYGRTALHVAAFHGHIELCKFLIKKGELKMDNEDRNGESPFHFAVSGNRVNIVRDLLKLISSLEKEEEMMQYLVFSTDIKKKTTLHKAAANGNKEMIEVLLGCIGTDEGKRNRISKSDEVRETALHEAARGGHTEAVKYLLRHGSSPLLERNQDDKTALHYAVQLEDAKRAIQVVELLLDHLQSDDEKTLLLWASATGVGTAEESAKGEVREFLQTKKRAAASSSNNLLRIAIEQGLENTAWELITRGADIQKIRDCSWTNPLNSEQRHLLDNLLRHIEVMPDLGRDQATGDDSLGRNHFAEGLASLFLNPFVKTPVTVGISGDWGMGKSSLMVQTEIALLKAAAQLAFPNLLQIEKFPGFKEWEISKHGQRKFEKIRKAVKHLLVHSTPKSLNEDEDPLVCLLENYQQRYHHIYRSFAVMDRSEMFTKVDSLRRIPAILTVQYNAWHYQNESEAWAGLAVEITKVIEDTMNIAQTIRTCFRYAWNDQRRNIRFVLILPCLFILFIAGWIAWAAWLLISRSIDKELVRLIQGLSVPVTALTIVWSLWTAFRQLFSVMKPISHQIMLYMRLPDHSGNLGYQQKVISDIKFLKAQIGEKPSWVWKFIACQWFWNLLGLYAIAETVEGTRIPKLPPASTDDLRIIVFVDDLDRCEDTVILKVLSAVNLVLAACEINVVLGMDTEMIARAISNKIEHSKKKEEETVALANKYISKIVQLPVALPDPTEAETEKFLNRQLGVVPEGGSDEGFPSEAEDGSIRMTMADRPQSSSVGACHVAVNVSQSKQNEQRKRPTGFLAQLLQSNGTPPAPSKLLQSAALNSVLLMSKYYSGGELKALKYLREYASDDRKLPREWKRFLNYHRLAWNILCKSGQVKSLANWQPQLVMWIFCCWEWKDQMDTIIEKWEELASTQDDPSLSNIVERYTKKEYDDGHHLHNQWMKLQKALGTLDVSLDCILAFQKFRLHCEVGHLHRFDVYDI